jgi:type II secretory pathway pseudopilin PulG
VECLVVIAVIAVLAALLFPATHMVRTQGKRAAAMHNLRQVGTAFLIYSQEHENRLPRRVVDPRSEGTPKWPALLAGSDGAGTPDLSTNYIGDVRAYLAPGDTTEVSRPDLFAYVTSNDRNHTSWIMNGYNEIGSLDDPQVEVRTLNLVTPAQTILLGIQKFGDGHFYMDTANGDNREVLNLAAYDGGSPYFFADGAVRFITQSDYLAPIRATPPPAIEGVSTQGDWLWLADKNPVPRS